MSRDGATSHVLPYLPSRSVIGVQGYHFTTKEYERQLEPELCARLEAQEELRTLATSLAKPSHAHNIESPSTSSQYSSTSGRVLPYARLRSTLNKDVGAVRMQTPQFAWSDGPSQTFSKLTTAPSHIPSHLHRADPSSTDSSMAVTDAVAPPSLTFPALPALPPLKPHTHQHIASTPRHRVELAALWVPPRDSPAGAAATAMPVLSRVARVDAALAAGPQLRPARPTTLSCGRARGSPSSSLREAAVKPAPASRRHRHNVTAQNIPFTTHVHSTATHLLSLPSATLPLTASSPRARPSSVARPLTLTASVAVRGAMEGTVEETQVVPHTAPAVADAVGDAGTISGANGAVGVASVDSMDSMGAVGAVGMRAHRLPLVGSAFATKVARTAAHAGTGGSGGAVMAAGVAVSPHAGVEADLDATRIWRQCVLLATYGRGGMACARDGVAADRATLAAAGAAANAEAGVGVGAGEDAGAGLRVGTGVPISVCLKGSPFAEAAGGAGSDTAEPGDTREPAGACQAFDANAAHRPESTGAASPSASMSDGICVGADVTADARNSGAGYTCGIGMDDCTPVSLPVPIPVPLPVPACVPAAAGSTHSPRAEAHTLPFAAAAGSIAAISSATAPTTVSTESAHATTPSRRRVSASSQPVSASSSPCAPVHHTRPQHTRPPPPGASLQSRPAQSPSHCAAPRSGSPSALAPHARTHSPCVSVQPRPSRPLSPCVTLQTRHSIYETYSMGEDARAPIVHMLDLRPCQAALQAQARAQAQASLQGQAPAPALMGAQPQVQLSIQAVQVQATAPTHTHMHAPVVSPPRSPRLPALAPHCRPFPHHASPHAIALVPVPPRTPSPVAPHAPARAVARSQSVADMRAPAQSQRARADTHDVHAAMERERQGVDAAMSTPAPVSASMTVRPRRLATHASEVCVGIAGAFGDADGDDYADGVDACDAEEVCGDYACDYKDNAKVYVHNSGMYDSVDKMDECSSMLPSLLDQPGYPAAPASSSRTHTLSRDTHTATQVIPPGAVLASTAPHPTPADPADVDMPADMDMPADVDIAATNARPPRVDSGVDQVIDAHDCTATGTYSTAGGPAGAGIDPVSEQNAGTGGHTGMFASAGTNPVTSVVTGAGAGVAVDAGEGEVEADLAMPLPAPSLLARFSRAAGLPLPLPLALPTAPSSALQSSAGSAAMSTTAPSASSAAPVLCSPRHAVPLPLTPRVPSSPGLSSAPSPIWPPHMPSPARQLAAAAVVERVARVLTDRTPAYELEPGPLPDPTTPTVGLLRRPSARSSLHAGTRRETVSQLEWRLRDAERPCRGEWVSPQAAHWLDAGNSLDEEQWRATATLSTGNVEATGDALDAGINTTKAAANNVKGTYAGSDKGSNGSGSVLLRQRSLVPTRNAKTTTSTPSSIAAPYAHLSSHTAPRVAAAVPAPAPALVRVTGVSLGSLRASPAPQSAHAPLDAALFDTHVSTHVPVRLLLSEIHKYAQDQSLLPWSRAQYYRAHGRNSLPARLEYVDAQLAPLPTAGPEIDALPTVRMAATRSSAAGATTAATDAASAVTVTTAATAAEGALAASTTTKARSTTHTRARTLAFTAARTQHPALTTTTTHTVTAAAAHAEVPVAERVECFSSMRRRARDARRKKREWLPLYRLWRHWLLHHQTLPTSQFDGLASPSSRPHAHTLRALALPFAYALCTRLPPSVAALSPLRRRLLLAATHAVLGGYTDHHGHRLRSRAHPHGHVCVSATGPARDRYMRPNPALLGALSTGDAGVTTTGIGTTPSRQRALSATMSASSSMSSSMPGHMAGGHARASRVVQRIDRWLASVLADIHASNTRVRHSAALHAPQVPTHSSSTSTATTTTATASSAPTTLTLVDGPDGLPAAVLPAAPSPAVTLSLGSMTSQREAGSQHRAVARVRTCRHTAPLADPFLLHVDAAACSPEVLQAYPHPANNTAASIASAAASNTPHADVGSAEHPASNQRPWRACPPDPCSSRAHRRPRTGTYAHSRTGLHSRASACTSTKAAKDPPVKMPALSKSAEAPPVTATTKAAANAITNVCGVVTTTASPRADALSTSVSTSESRAPPALLSVLDDLQLQLQLERESAPSRPRASGTGTGDGRRRGKYAAASSASVASTGPVRMRRRVTVGTAEHVGVRGLWGAASALLCMEGADVAAGGPGGGGGDA